MNQSVLQAVLEPVVTGLGYEFLGIERLGDRGSGIVRIYIDHPGGVTLDDCAAVSHQASAVLDVEGVIADRYVLEVSSPGLDRPLFTPEQYAKFVGSIVSVRLRRKLDGRRNLEGVLSAIDESGFVVEMDGREWSVPYATVERTRLVPQWPDTKRRKPGTGAPAANAR